MSRYPTETLWSALPVAALIVDENDAIVHVNGPAESFLNASSRTLEGSQVWDKVLVDVSLEGAFERVRNSLAPLSLHGVKVGSGTKSAEPCDIQVAPLLDTPGHTLILLLPREIADRLGRAKDSQNAAKSAIGMSEMLAHEIKNPLAGITGAAQLLSMNLSPEDQELTDLIVEESRRIVALLEQVEQFGNLRPPERKAVNIHDILDRARKSATVGFAAHCVIEERYDPSLPPTFADGDQLLQVFLNLLKNASQVLGTGGTIIIRTFYELSLRVRRPDGTGAAVPLQVEIRDDGPGIPPEIIADIFDPFVSGRENGTGLGLALVSKIVSEHEGWISVDSEPGRTVFRISLPIAPKTEDD
jgi:two-component system nitrogen regulation sensor histidine kinase GlnL